MQLFINMWHYLQWLFTHMYIHHLITYSCMESIKILWGLFLPLTNLLISFHQQSSVLLHQGTTFIHLQLSSLCNWLSSWLYPLHNIWSCLLLSSVCNRLSLIFKSMSLVVLSSAYFCNISQNIHCKAPVSSQHSSTKSLKLKKCSGHGKMIDPTGELLHTKDLLPGRVTIYFYS